MMNMYIDNIVIKELLPYMNYAGWLIELFQ